MLRLLKLALFAAIGYAIYELYLGITEGGGDASLSGEGADEARRTRGASMTGSGQGMEIKSEDESGTSIPHTVGRGVVS